MKRTLFFFMVVVLLFGTFASCKQQEIKSVKEEPMVEKKSLAELSFDFINTHYQAYLCVQMVTFKNANSPEHSERLYDDVPMTTWAPKSGMDTEQWADVLIASKMAGGWLTTKHHGGFCLWDSKYTDYDVGSTDYPEDVVGKFVETFRRRGLKVGLYYSILDYHHGIDNGTVTPKKIQFMKNQITELLTNYGPIDYINFDGWSTWPTTPTFDDVPYYEIHNTVKAIQPNCLIINHQYESNLAHADIPFADAAGRPYPYHKDYMRPTAGSDFIQTDWFWDDENFDVARSKEYILSQLDSYNSHNGVYILNVSPDNSGHLPADAVQRLNEVAEVWDKPEPLKEVHSHWVYQYNVEDNLAFMQKATQSSTHAFFNDMRAYPRAEIALDGVLEGHAKMEQTSMTRDEYKPWWMVELAEQTNINEITIYNRTDADMDKLNNFTVKIMDDEKDIVWKALIEEAPGKKLTLKVENVSGKYVKIQLNGTAPLALAEVIVK